MPRFYGTLLFSLFAGMAFICLAFAIGHGSTAAFDEWIRESIHSFSSSTLTSLFLVISFTGKVLFLIGLGSLLTAILALLRRHRWLVVFFITMVGEIVLEVGTKAIFERPRPDPFFGISPAESYSFPSGHALGALCFYGVLAWLVTEGQNKFLRTFVLAAAAIWIFLIGVSRIYLGMHYPTDVLGGFLLGGSWLAAVTSIVISKERRLKPPGTY